MNVFKPALHRKFFIDRKIREKTYPNASTLARDYRLECGKRVNSRTIAADLAVMRDELGAPLHYDAEKRGYIYTNPAFTLDFLKSAPSDLKHLLHPGQKPDITALDGCRETFLSGGTKRADPLSGRISVLTAGDPQSETGAITQLVEQGVTEGRQLILEYRRFEYKSAIRRLSLTIQPHHLIYIEGNCFVFGAAMGDPALPWALLNRSHIEAAALSGVSFSPLDHLTTEMTGEGDIKVYLRENQVDTLVVFTPLYESAEPEWTLYSRSEVFFRKEQQFVRTEG